MTDREAFEKWAIRAGIDGLFAKLDNGQYLHCDTKYAWMVWQAACKYKDEQNTERHDVTAAFERRDKNRLHGY